MLLALDTATQYASIALYDGESVVAELNWRSERRHTVELAPQVDNLLRLAGVPPAALTALAVSIGPGSYTGTRIALSYAKGIVLARDLPLIGIPTLDALAYPHLPAPKPVCAVVAAGRGRYCWAVYAPDEAWPQRLTDFGLDKLPELLPQVQPPLLFVGELSPEDKDRLIAEWGADVTIVSPARALRRAGALAELAWARLQAGDVNDPISLSPIYLG
jgi:tRNA threonylcarbamoyladenosine biosynthesis protein TsaB